MSLPSIGINTITTGMFQMTLSNKIYTRNQNLNIIHDSQVYPNTNNDEDDINLTPEQKIKLDKMGAEIKKQQAKMAIPLPIEPPKALKELPIIEGEEHSYGVKKSCDITIAFAINNWIREHQKQGWNIHWSASVVTMDEDMMYITQQILMIAPQEVHHLPLFKPVRMVYCCFEICRSFYYRMYCTLILLFDFL